MPQQLIVGASQGKPVVQSGKQSNRHGLIAGATGTGKTVTLQILAEGFSRMGVPVFAADIKGDLSGISQPGKPHQEIDRRLAEIPLPDYQQRGYPTIFWDIYARKGHPVRTTISEMGPLILSNLLQLNDTQSGVLYACFAVADDQGMLLLDLKDLRSLLTWMGDNRKALKSDYGNITAASIGAIQRRLLVLKEQGAERFFGEPAVNIQDFMQRDFSGNGVISLLSADRLTREAPHLYATFLIWLLSELFEELPEAGDLEQPKLVLFFDEAHLLFKGMPKALLEKIEQVVRLIRSKAVGVYFVTQSPLDIPESILGQLGLKIQHALRAYTPKDQRAIKAISQGFRSDGKINVNDVITQLAQGEALVSCLDERGAPTIVATTLIRPPESRIGAATAQERNTLRERSPMNGRYEKKLDRRSAYEMLQERAARALQDAEQKRLQAEREKDAVKARKKTARQRKPRRSSRQSVGEAMMKSAARSIGRTLGTKLMRGILGSLLK